jgi:hypothetical protein
MRIFPRAAINLTLQAIKSFCFFLQKEVLSLLLRGRPTNPARAVLFSKKEPKNFLNYRDDPWPR